MNRFTTQEEEDTLRAFWNDDTPAPVGEVRYYQEEYHQQEETNELQNSNSSQEAEKQEQLRLEREEAEKQEQLRREREEDKKQEQLRREREEAKKQEQLRREREEAEKQEQLRREREEAEKQEQLRREREEAEKQEQLRREREKREKQLKALREIEEEEAAIAEMARQLAIKKAATMLDVDFASVDATGVLQQVTNTGRNVNGSDQGASTTVPIKLPTAHLGETQSDVPSLNENSLVTVNEEGINNQTSIPQTTGGESPNSFGGRLSCHTNTDQP